ncbi:MAG: Maf and M48 domain-containing protein [Candidatus Omnitrophica bacterium]|jgi:MAF protein|nr:Maf and M48 domain-containing protein [Candidatus Omnitrophota bacterium]
MKNVYLASDSKARKKLLDIFGLKFKVLPAKIKEKNKISGISYAQLAKQNALKKAEYVAGKVKSGIIIAADTIVVQGKKIYGKPKNLQDARRMLKKLSSKPQLLYTGVAVIDKDSRKTVVGYEKTKIYMDKLSDKDVSAYFAHTSPLDKAGSFDIQGRGAFFIRRIEGCFYNVVGLPVRKLYQILKQFNIKICLLLVLSFIFGGCTTEYNLATKEEEVYMYSTDKEVQMGKSIAAQVEAEYKPVEDPLMQKRVEDIGKKIAAVCDRKEIDYHFMVLNENEVNAVSLPGGYVYIFKGLVDKVSSDDELAGVIGHEVAHIVARHSIKKLQGALGYSLLRVLIAQASSDARVGNAADLAFTDLMMGYSREDELLADQLGARYEKLAGYDPKGMISFLEKLQAINRKKPQQPYSYFKTHPYGPDRIRVVRQELGGKMNFNEYINIEQKPHE